MAKIGELEVETIKIKDGALTSWFAPSGSNITVVNGTGNPTFIWVTAATGTLTLTRNRDGKVIYTGTGYQQVFAADGDPEATETYSITGGNIVGAKVRKK